MATISCVRTFIGGSPMPAGTIFQILYEFTNLTEFPNTVVNFWDNSWFGKLQIPIGGLGLTATGWIYDPTSPTLAGSGSFEFNEGGPGVAELAAYETGSVLINVVGLDPPGGVVEAQDFNTVQVLLVDTYEVEPFLSTNEVKITAAMVCVAEGTLVALADGRQMPIEQLRPGHLLVNHTGRPVRLSAAIRVEQQTTSLIQLEQGSLGADVPSAPLRIRHGHPLLVAGKEVLPENLLQQPGVAQVQLEKPVHVYTLLTEQRSFVEMQGALVGTWSEAAWQNFVDNDERSARMRWSTLE